MNSGEILKLFEGLTEKQVRELRRAIMPTLWELRKAIVQGAEKQQDTAEKKSHHEQGQNKQRLRNDTMQSKN